MSRQSWIAIPLLLFCAEPLPGQVRLECKLAENASHHKETTARIEQKLIFGGMTVDTSSSSRCRVRSTSANRNDAGQLAVTEKVESFKISTSAGGSEFEFNSEDPDKKGESPLEVLRDVYKALASRTTIYLYNKDNRVEEIKSDDDILGSVPVQIQQLIQSQLDPETIKRVANEELNLLPKTPVNTGETWERIETGNFGSGQVMTFKSRLTFTGTLERDGRQLAKITTKVLSVDFALQNSPLPFTLKNSKLDVPESEGLVLVDLEGGQIVEVASKMRIVGDLTFALNNGMELPSKLDLKMDQRTVVTP